ncbi:hypothetical protein FISHEDRAFT_68336 [Fistulina hepatica ATCC 64428]|uniref:Uncharacterized protein n=1 Tax=Fistulina hepatica ATCC 64428 TaxID=1128425 RepID=A0A0D7AT24_9AGAR|nr:hypothetical protein FISHEDRAFT_68336 [Fistulina hepatica ATCC 64428]
MTEYDYSLEGQQAYQSNQRRVSNWAENIAGRHLKDPFTPATPAGTVWNLPDDRHLRDRRERERERSKKRSSSAHHIRSQSQTMPTRSYTSPTAPYGQPLQPPVSAPPYVSFNQNIPPVPPLPILLQKNYQHPQAAKPQSNYRGTYQTAYPQAAYAQPQQSQPLSTYPQNSRHIRSHSYHASSQPYRDPSAPPPMPTAQRPVIPMTHIPVATVPQRIEVVIPSTPRGHAPGRAGTPLSPTKRPPLLKRLLTQLTGGSRGSKSNRSQSQVRVDEPRMRNEDYRRSSGDVGYYRSSEIDHHPSRKDRESRGRDSTHERRYQRRHHRTRSTSI